MRSRLEQLERLEQWEELEASVEKVRTKITISQLRKRIQHSGAMPLVPSAEFIRLRCLDGQFDAVLELNRWALFEDSVAEWFVYLSSSREERDRINRARTAAGKTPFD